MRRKEVATSSLDVLTMTRGQDNFGNEGINNFACRSFEDFRSDKDFEYDPYITEINKILKSGEGLTCCPVPLGSHRGASAPRGPGGLAGCEAVLMFTTSIPQSGQRVVSVGRVFNRRNRRMWSRAIWGLKLPGRYYFLTLTTSPKSPSLESMWKAFRKWMKRYRPGIQWLYCFTNEGKGKGVLHMVLRLGMKQKRLDAKEVRAYWNSLTRGTVDYAKIRYVPESKKGDLAGYVANQKSKRGMAKEMGYQSAVRRWNRSRGWLPQGFTRAFSRAWMRVGDIPFGLKLKVMSDYLARYCDDNGTWTPGKMHRDPELGWVME